MRQNNYKTEFVKSIPAQLKDGVLYISLEYKIAMHRCMCGCGSEISTPISKKFGWVISFDGEDSSLYPSIGNGAYACHSHYYLQEGTVKWLEPTNGTLSIRRQKKINWWEKLLIKSK